MPPPAELQPIEDPIIKVYADAWAHMQAEFESLTPAQARKRARLQELQRGIEKAADDLDDGAGEWIRSQFPRAYGAGAVAGQPSAAEFIWTQVHQEAVEELAQSLFEDLLKATTGVKESAKSLIRTAAKEGALAANLEGRTAVQAAKDMQIALQKQGLWSVIYRDGSRHGLAEYSQVAIRTKTAVAYNMGTLNQHAEVKFFQCIDGPQCGWSFHQDPTLARGLIVTREEAQSAPISHPNCRRVFGPRPDVTSKQGAPDLGPSAAQTHAQQQADDARRATQARRRAKTSKTAKKTPTKPRNDRIAESGLPPTGNASDLSVLRREVGDLDGRLADASTRLKAAPGGRARAKIKAEMSDLEAQRAAKLAKIEELENGLPPIKPDPVLPPKPIDPLPPTKPIVNPDQIPTVDDILKDHFGWTRPRAMREQMEIRLGRVPDTATIRKSRPGWTTPVAERERARLIKSITDEYPGVPVPKEFQFVTLTPAKVTPKVAPKPVPKGTPLRGRIDDFRRANEQDLQDFLDRVNPNVGELTQSAHVIIRQAATLDPEWAARFDDVFDWQVRGGRGQWVLPEPRDLVRSGVSKARLQEVIDQAEGVIRKLPPEKLTAYERYLTYFDNAGTFKGGTATNGQFRDWLESRVDPIGHDVLDRILVQTKQPFPDMERSVELSQRFYARVMDKKLAGRRQNGRTRIRYGSNERSRGRAYYNSGDNIAYIGGHQGVQVYVHEVGHGLENNLLGADGDEWQRMAIQFRDARGTDGVGDKFKLTEIYKGSGEVGYKDEFISHYMGKKYNWPDTEIISMGMEMLFDNPGKLLARDPEYFWFMVGLLSGDL